MTAAPPAMQCWRTARRSLPLARATVLGILNITPDSFSDGGRHLAPADAVRAAKIMRGADIFDVGGESTRPGARAVSEADEIARVVPVIEQLGPLGLPISVDTRRANVARAALRAGAEIVNDVSGLLKDPAMVSAALDARAGVVIMHMRGEPDTMDREAVYDDVVADVTRELAERRDRALDAGIAPEAIVLDPGLGFAKTTEHNLALIHHLDAIAALGHPVMVGPSRKRFLGAVTGLDVGSRDEATAAACVAARIFGASLFRVHNVGRAREALDVADAVLSTFSFRLSAG
ncbi:MAG: dihydropteroate synthase [Gemmatimonadales bacterium]